MFEIPYDEPVINAHFHEPYLSLKFFLFRISFAYTKCTNRYTSARTVHAPRNTAIHQTICKFSLKNLDNSMIKSILFFLSKRYLIDKQTKPYAKPFFHRLKFFKDKWSKKEVIIIAWVIVFFWTFRARVFCSDRIMKEVRSCQDLESHGFLSLFKWKKDVFETRLDTLLTTRLLVYRTSLLI